jgi:hypothetical protein
MFVIQTRNYILKWVNSSVTLSVLFSILPKWHVIKTKRTCRFGESGIGRTSGGCYVTSRYHPCPKGHVTYRGI